MKIKKRHSRWFKIARPIIHNLISKKFNYTCTPCNIKPPFIVLGNHTTDYDAFFIADAFQDPIHFVMSDHITTLPVVGKLIPFLVGTIPITKSSRDTQSLRSVISVIHQGGAVGIFPEGNKSFSGDVSYIKPTIAKVLKKLNVPLILFTIEGGYFSSPRWTKNKRLGRVYGHAAKILSAEEIEQLSTEQLYNIIKETLHINAYEVQKQNPSTYVGPNLAENIETFLYVCPECKSISTLHGEGNTITCSHCSFKATYNEYGYLDYAPMPQLDQLDRMQKEYLLHLPWDTYPKDKMITQDNGWVIARKITKYKSKKLGTFTLQLTTQTLTFTNKKQTTIIPLQDIAGYAIEGVNGIQLWLRDGTVYRMKNKGAVSGLKYVNMISAITKTPMKF